MDLYKDIFSKYLIDGNKNENMFLCDCFSFIGSSKSLQIVLFSPLKKLKNPILDTRIYGCLSVHPCSVTLRRHEQEFPFPTFSQDSLVNSLPHGFSFLFPIPKLGNTVLHSHSQSQNLGTLFFIPILNPKF